MASLELYVQGAQVWIFDSEKVWKCCSLLEPITEQILAQGRVRAVDEEEEEVSVALDPLPFLRNPEILIGKDDLTELSYLHEPAVLFNLQHRFLQREVIYTYCGIVLVAINPYADMGHLYRDEVIQVYIGQGKSVRQELDPHIFAVAEEAIYDLTEFHKSQSIIVSGESGAGKTVSAKLAMRYFAAVSGARESSRSHQGIETKVLASNPIMEAFGNAKTIRNDNSSRFGKLIQMDFTERKTIAGAQMKTYLLEKSRVVKQARQERNYHIFYQLCAARDAVSELSALNLMDPMRFHYTSMGRAPEVEGVDDLGDFRQLQSSFDLLGFSKGETADVFRTLAGILHLGNVPVQPDGTSEAVELLSGRLWGLDAAELRTWLTVRQFTAGREVCRAQLSTEEAVASRDAMAKLIYESLFNWIVAKINSALSNSIPSPVKKAKVRGKTAAPSFIGILDIYGFETFEVNSFEQFSINYANEKLQQQFNQVWFEHVFKLEQEEYVREGLDWVDVSFVDNAPCIALIEDRAGIVDLLDEQSKLGQGTDDSWLAQMTAAGSLKKSPHFALPKIRAPAFIVKHFASDVAYSVQGFLEKNRDTVSQELVGVFKNSKFPFLDSILSAQFDRVATASIRKKGPGVLGSLLASGQANSGKQLRKSVATQFRESLSELMDILCSTRPHYIRCIKPNDEKAAFSMQPQRAMQQLRACGVLETVRISAAGYPSRWPYGEFGRRYRVLSSGLGLAAWRDRPREFAQAICQRYLKDERSFGLGRTKVFFRTGQVAELEHARGTALDKAAGTIQRAWRSHTARKELGRKRRALQILQAAGRAYLAWHFYHYLRMHRASIAIQAQWKAHSERKRYLLLVRVTLGIQTLFRARQARQSFLKAKLELVTVAFQARCRGFIARAEKRVYIHKVILVQCCARRWLARRELKRLKIEARSSNHLLKLNKGLENKIVSLQQKLDAQVKSSGGKYQTLEKKLTAQSTDLERLQKSLQESQARVGVLEKELASRAAKLIGKEEAEKQRMASVSEDINAIQKELESRTEECRLGRVEQEQLHRQLADTKESLVEAISAKEQGERRAQCAEEELGVYREMVEAELGAGFSRGLSTRNSMSSVNGRSPTSTVRENGSAGSSPPGTLVGGAPADLIAMIKLQRKLDALVKEKDDLAREASKLGVLVSARPVAEAWAAALGTYEAMAAQDAQMAMGRMIRELDGLLKERASLGPVGVDWQRALTSAQEENERVREEAVMLRSILATRLDDNANVETNGEDGETRLEREVCLIRQCREQKIVIGKLMEELDLRDATLRDRQVEIRNLRDQFEVNLGACAAHVKAKKALLN